MISGRAEPEKVMLDTPRIDSESLGDPLRHRKLEELEERLEALPRAPRERGRVELIVARSEGGRRESPDRVRLEADAGVPGDAWGRQQGPHAERAITVMQLVMHADALMAYVEVVRLMGTSSTTVTHLAGRACDLYDAKQALVPARTRMYGCP